MGNFTFIIYGNLNSENRYVGQGCRRTPAWETTVPKSEVDKKREEFWIT
jgi:hypothetical protein